MVFINAFLASLSSILLCTSVLGQCTLPVTTQDIIFQAKIHYLTPQLKADPYISVLLDGRVKDFILDTGTNHHVFWGTSSASSGTTKRKLHTLHSAVDEEVTHLTLADSAGRTLTQEIGIIKDAVLAKRRIAGLISPQQLAGKHPFLIDFKRGCFTVVRHVDLNKLDNYRIYRGRLEANPYQVMLVTAHLKNNPVLLQIDSGAKDTSIYSPLIRNFPLDSQRSVEQSIAIIGKSPAKLLPFRRVDLALNGLFFDKLSIEEVATYIDINEFKLMGNIGMDVLKDLMIIADFEHNNFHLFQEVL